MINKESDCQSYQMQVPRSELWQLRLKQLSFFLFHFCPINSNITKHLCKLDCRIQWVKTKNKKQKKEYLTNKVTKTSSIKGRFGLLQSKFCMIIYSSGTLFFFPKFSQQPNRTQINVIDKLVKCTNSHTNQFFAHQDLKCISNLLSISIFSKQPNRALSKS